MIKNYDTTSGLYYDFSSNPVIYPLERWTPITDKSVEGVFPIYLVSDLGRVYDTSTNTFLSQYEDARGYFQVYLKTSYGSKCKPIYRIVIIEFEGFDPNPKRDHVDHISGIKSNNSLYNLRWLTKAENTRAALDMGLMCRKLTDGDVHQICQMLGDGVDRNIILDFISSKGFTHPKTAFYNIYNRISWTRISDQYPNFQDYRIRKPIFTDEQVHLVCRCLEQNMKHNEILDTLGFDRSAISNEERTVLYTAISHIKHGTTSPEISSIYNIDKSNQKKLFSEDEVHKICQMLSLKMKANDILLELGYGDYTDKINHPKEYYCYMNAISRIRTRSQYKDISALYDF